VVIAMDRGAKKAQRLNRVVYATGEVRKYCGLRMILLESNLFLTGSRDVLKIIGPGRMMQETVECGSCDATGKVFKDKDKCKKCKGKMIVSEKKLLEIYMPRGSK